jgi:CRISPR system Cascade subunit CasB
MEVVKNASETLPDFVELKQRFDRMGSGPIAEMRRVRSVHDLADIPAYYRWLQGHSSAHYERIAFFMPYVSHKEAAIPLGQQLKKKGVSEMRLFQVIRSEVPHDLEQLRRLVIQLDPSLNWNEFGKTLYYWGRKSKQHILEDYFTPVKKPK